MSNNQLQVKRETIDVVAARIKDFQNKGELFFPPNYVPENALKSAWLMIQETKDRNDKPALDVCTRESIANALLSMTIQSLNPDKKQCYFIVRGNKLCLDRSYFGSVHVAKTIDENIEDIYPDVVYKNDEFEYSKQRGITIISKHIQKLENIKKDEIIAAYACVLYKDGKERATIMTMDEIKQAWKQSQMKPVNEKGEIKEGSTHDKFMAEMCKKTVVNRACKPIINSSDDRNIVVKYAKLTDTEIVEAEVEEEIIVNANQEFIDIDAKTVDISTGEVVNDIPEPEIVPAEATEQVVMEGPGF